MTSRTNSPGSRGRGGPGNSYDPKGRPRLEVSARMTTHTRSGVWRKDHNVYVTLGNGVHTVILIDDARTSHTSLQTKLNSTLPRPLLRAVLHRHLQSLRPRHDQSRSVIQKGRRAEPCITTTPSALGPAIQSAVGFTNRLCHSKCTSRVRL